jgi:chromosome segregation protein
LHIKSLVLQGFKSFADKEIITFNKGISCIVGPNGSGKSNLLDAVKWIMGEQNIRELRGGEIDDIAFNGSKERQPSNIVIASMILTDIDRNIADKWGFISEINITRKYYRSGEKEYYINNKSCKLKDIKEFFYDIGLSHKSIILIEQGKVDKINQATPEELREIFEEFSGIINYKDKKREAQKKLESTKLNLDRIKDIFIEVEENKKVYINQIKELERYRRLVNDKKILQKSLFSINYKRVVDTLEKLNKEKKSYFEEKSLLEKSIAQQVKMYGDEEKKVNSLKNEYSALNERRQNLKNEIDKSKNNIKIYEEKIKLYSDEKLKIEDRIGSLQKEINENKEKNNLLTDKINQINASFNEIKKIKEELDIQLKKILIAIENYQSELKTINKNIYQEMSNEEKVERTIYEKNVDINNIQNELKRINNEKKIFDAEINTYLKLKDEILRKEEISNQNYFQLMESYKNKQKLLEQLKISYECEGKKIAEKEDRKKTIDNRIILLESLIEQIVVGEFKTYKKFIEKFPYTLLIDKINLKTDAELMCYGNIIIFNEAIKNELINLYKNEFWPINFIFEQDLGNFMEKIKENPPRLVNNNLIFNGLYYTGKKPNDDTGSLVNYKNELKKLIEEKANIENELINLRKITTVMFNDLKLQEGELEKISNQVNDLTTSRDKLENEKLQCEKELNKINSRLDVISKERDRLSEELKIYTNEVKIANENKSKIKSHLTDLKTRAEIIKKRLNELENETNELKNRSIEITIQYKGLQKDKEITEQTYKENNNNIEKRHKELTELNNKLNNYNELFNVAINKKKEIEESLSEFLNKHNELTLYNKELLDKINCLEPKILLMKNEIDKLSNDYREIEKKYNRILINEAKQISDKENLESQYKQLYDSSLDKEYINYLGEANIEEINTQLVKIEEEIDKLGPINMGAETEYNKLNERSLFLKNQINDLEGAIDKISEMIYNFDKESVNRFNETFHEVKENFKRVVNILFNGGSAEIKILDENDLLNSGVEVYIQPPGKKLQNMNLLSGGEKALMSCALLFAFFLYRKAPFCFLDEVDAPLDDANIGRFLHMVKTLSKETQFFIISHNYNTMIESDNIYGITMKEPGVSGIFSLKKENLIASP